MISDVLEIKNQRSPHSKPHPYFPEMPLFPTVQTVKLFHPFYFPQIPNAAPEAGNAVSFPHLVPNTFFAMPPQFEDEADIDPNRSNYVLPQVQGAQDLAKEIFVEENSEILLHQPTSPSKFRSNSKRQNKSCVHIEANPINIKLNHKCPTNQRFLEICLSRNIYISPKLHGLIPPAAWESIGEEVTFGDAVVSFFQKPMSVETKFIYKLFNALVIGEHIPSLKFATGVEWVEGKVVKVTGTAFAQLLGIKTINNSLFHQQGNFPTHGFVELHRDDALTVLSSIPYDVDFDKKRLWYFPNGNFNKAMSSLQLVMTNEVKYQSGSSMAHLDLAFQFQKSDQRQKQ